MSFLKPRVQALCPACRHPHAALLGRLGLTTYNPWRFWHKRSGGIFKCSKCGIDFCVAGGEVYRLFGERVPAPHEPERLGRLREVPLFDDSRWSPPKG